MISFLYDITIAPIQLWMGYALDWGYKLTGSYGWAIVFMSLVVNIFVLPIYIQAERWQEEERRLKASISKKENMIKRSFKGQERFAMISTLYRQSGYSPFLALRSSLGFFLQIPFFIAAYVYLSGLPELSHQKFGFLTNLGEPDGLLVIGGFAINLLPLIMTIINLASSFVYTTGLTRRDKIQLIGMSLLFLVLLYPSPSGLVLYWTCNNVFSLLKNICYKLYSSIVSKKLFAKKERVKNDLLSKENSRKYLKTYWYLSITLGLLICFYFPIKLITSDLAVFVNWKEDVITLISFFQLWILFLFALHLIFYRNELIIKTIISFFFIIGLYAIIYGFIFVPDLGSMDNFVLQKSNKLLEKGSYAWDVVVCCFIFILLIIFNRLRGYRVLQICCTLFAISLVIDLGLSLNQIKGQGQIIRTKINSSMDSSFANSFFNFSPEKNVLVIMLDNFVGKHFEEIIKRHPELKSKFTGFTFYKDTISEGSVTLLGKAPIIGGKELSPKELQKKDERSLEDRINTSYKNFFASLISRGWNVAVHDNTWLNPEFFRNKSDNLILVKNYYLWNGFIKEWEKSNKLDLSKDSYFPSFFIAFSIFKISPQSLKKKVYSEGRWLGTIEKNSLLKENARRISQLQYVSKFSKVGSNSPTYKFFSNEIAHQPFGLNQQCKPFEPDEKIAFHSTSQQLQNEYCVLLALQDLLDWLKIKRIYDNSYIVIVSDHGKLEEYNPSKDSEFSDYKIEKNGTPWETSKNALLLVKPFKAQGDLVVNSSSLMMNSDVRSLISRAIGLDSKEALVDIENPQRERTFFTGHWGRNGHERDRLSNLKSWTVHGSQFEKNNWNRSQ